MLLCFCVFNWTILVQFVVIFFFCFFPLLEQSFSFGETASNDAVAGMSCIREGDTDCKLCTKTRDATQRIWSNENCTHSCGIIVRAFLYGEWNLFLIQHNWIVDNIWYTSVLYLILQYSQRCQTTRNGSFYSFFWWNVMPKCRWMRHALIIIRDAYKTTWNCIEN